MNNTQWDTICDLADDIVEVLILNQPHTTTFRSVRITYVTILKIEVRAYTRKSIYALDILVLFVQLINFWIEYLRSHFYRSVSIARSTQYLQIRIERFITFEINGFCVKYFAI